MKPTVLIAFLLVSNGNVIADDSSRQAADCRALVETVTPPLDEGEKHMQYLDDAAKAYRDCRGAQLPVEVRVNALVKYAIASSTSGEKQTAVAVLTEAIDILDRASGRHADLSISVLDRVASIETQAGLREAAIGHAKRAAETREKTYGKSSAEAAIGLVNLGLTHATFNDYAKGEELIRQAIRMAEKACGPECDALVEAYVGMQALYDSRGNKTEADKYAALAEKALPSRPKKN